MRTALMTFVEILRNMNKNDESQRFIKQAFVRDQASRSPYHRDNVPFATEQLLKAQTDVIDLYFEENFFGLFQAVRLSVQMRWDHDEEDDNVYPSPITFAILGPVGSDKSVVS